MKYTETGFRPFYHHFTAVPVNDKLRGRLQSFPGAEEAVYLLTYGYLDPERGLMLEVLAPAIGDGEQIRFGKGDISVREAFPIGDAAEEESMFFPDESGNMGRLFAEQIKRIREQYGASEEVEKTREMAFLDGSRCEPFADDIRVFLLRDGLEPEECPVRIQGVGEGCIIGALLQEPHQDFGYHKGDTVAFYVQKQEDRAVCFTDLNLPRKWKAEDLADGSMLEAAVAALAQEQTNERLLDLLEILRDSSVWVPYTVSKGKNGRKHQRKVPDILKNSDGQSLFPIFSTQEAMGDYGKKVSKVQKPVIEVIALARGNEKKPGAIVLNAFTEYFILNKELWTVIEEMKSMVE